MASSPILFLFSLTHLLLILTRCSADMNEPRGSPTKREPRRICNFPSPDCGPNNNIYDTDYATCFVQKNSISMLIYCTDQDPTITRSESKHKVDLYRMLTIAVSSCPSCNVPSTMFSKPQQGSLLEPQQGSLFDNLCKKIPDVNMCCLSQCLGTDLRDEHSLATCPNPYGLTGTLNLLHNPALDCVRGASRGVQSRSGGNQGGGTTDIARQGGNAGDDSTGQRENGSGDQIGQGENDGTDDSDQTVTSPPAPSDSISTPSHIPYAANPTVTTTTALLLLLASSVVLTRTIAMA